MARKFSEQTLLGQLGTLLALVAGFMTLFGAAFLALADQEIDKKYATDEDLLAVQTTVSEEVSTIKDTVEANTRTVQSTASSVDGLTLVVMDLQIDKIEGEIRGLEAEKRAEAAAWSERDEDQLRDKQKALADLNTQREILFTRLIASQTGVNQ